MHPELASSVIPDLLRRCEPGRLRAVGPRSFLHAAGPLGAVAGGTLAAVRFGLL